MQCRVHDLLFGQDTIRVLPVCVILAKRSLIGNTDNTNYKRFLSCTPSVQSVRATTMNRDSTTTELLSLLIEPKFAGYGLQIIGWREFKRELVRRGFSID